MIREIITNFSNYDGMSTVVTNLAEQFNKKGKEVEILYSKSSRGKPDTEITTKQLSSYEIYKYLKDKQGVVHSHFGTSFMATAMARRFNSNIKHIHTYHGIVDPEYYDNFRRDKYFDKLTLLLGKTDKLVAISKHEQTNFKRLFNKEPEVIYNGVNTDRFKEQENDKYDLPDKKIVGYVARMHEQKNHKMLLDVLERLPDNYHLLLGGDGPLYNNLVKQAKKANISDRVTFTGWVTKQELPSFYNACDVYACPSLVEGFGLTTLEAMACNTPVVVKSGTPVTEYVGNAGEVVDDELGMVRSIENLDDKQARKQAKKYDWSKIADRYLK